MKEYKRNDIVKILKGVHRDMEGKVKDERNGKLLIYIEAQGEIYSAWISIDHVEMVNQEGR